MTAIATTVLLPFVAFGRPLAGPQAIRVVFVGEHMYAADELAQFYDGLRWWSTRYPDVSWAIATEYAPAGPDPFAIDMCDEAQRAVFLADLLPNDWPSEPTILLFDSYASGQHFQCHGEPRGVADYTVPGLSLLETSSAPAGDLSAITAHVVGHLYGAKDSADGDIMDYTNIWHAYADGTVSEQTARAIGRPE